MIKEKFDKIGVCVHNSDFPDVDIDYSDRDKVKEYNFNLNIIKRAPETILALVVYKILENVFRKNKRFAEKRKHHSANFKILKKIFK